MHKGQISSQRFAQFVQKIILKYLAALKNKYKNSKERISGNISS